MYGFLRGSFHKNRFLFTIIFPLEDYCADAAKQAKELDDFRTELEADKKAKAAGAGAAGAAAAADAPPPAKKGKKPKIPVTLNTARFAELKPADSYLWHDEKNRRVRIFVGPDRRSKNVSYKEIGFEAALGIVLRWSFEEIERMTGDAPPFDMS